MRYESWLSYRYLTASKGRFLSFLHIVSIAGVAIGVAALIVVISVMTGFGNNLRDKIVGITPHLMVEKEVGVKDYQSVVQTIKAQPGVLAASGYIQGNIFLEDSGRAMAIAVRGIDPLGEASVTKVEEYLKSRPLRSLKDDEIIIGKGLAQYFDYKLGDKIILISPGSGLAGQGWRYELIVGGIFDSGMHDVDMGLVLVTLSKAQGIFDLPENTVTGIGVKIKDPAKAKEFQDKLYEVLGYSFLIKSWIDINRNLFEALFLEKWGLFIILSLMVLVASFNIISTLVVTVTSKIHDIGILKSVGATESSIHRIFTNQGIYIGLYGILWGLFSGFGICYILKNYIKVPEQIYSIKHVPVDVQLFDVLAIIFAAFIISFSATIYPARRAAKLEPVQALRYE